MPRTYEPIASTTLGADAVEIDFTSISGNYTDLILVCTGNSKASGSSVNGLRLRVNGDTGGNYSNTRLLGNGSSASSDNSGANATAMDAVDVPQASGERGMVRIQFMSYANTNVNKTWLMESVAPSLRVMRCVGLWRSTSAITSIKIYRDGSTNLASGFTASLYGVKAA